ncbi:aldose epimerase family protein [uncultured Bacteroides sp.]|uniref:aldose epimerase family protein n=1 Tax=uncultured Bacteroides sp. TaxID=162156 RepID=UPI002AA6C424|nr:aldose epimerase family protein [uncultured Bacteroides sp.]
MEVSATLWGNMAQGEEIYLFRITNENGAYVELTNLGATWVSAVVPDRHGIMGNVLLGYDTAEGYVRDLYYMGATIGRFANRIDGASFSIDGVAYRLERNDGSNTNHGGTSGFSHKLWQWKLVDDGVCFTITSPDKEGGYPGCVEVSVTFSWSEKNELTILYSGYTDKPTYLNLTNHAYFNLTARDGEIIDHILMIPSNRMLDTTSRFIPTGAYRLIDNTPFDFMYPRRLGNHLHDNDSQLLCNHGYNHCYVLKDVSGDDLLLAAILIEPRWGRRLEVMTTLPSVLLYTAGYYVQPDVAVCLEAQYLPDSPHHPHFPSCLLLPGKQYDERTIFIFKQEH